MLLAHLPFFGGVVRVYRAGQPYLATFLWSRLGSGQAWAGRASTWWHRNRGRKLRLKLRDFLEAKTFHFSRLSDVAACFVLSIVALPCIRDCRRMFFGWGYV